MTSIRPSHTGDIAAITALLEAHALPTADLVASQVAFRVEEEDGRIVAVIGMEQHGDTGLLRSLAVSPLHQGKGHGLRLVQSLEAEAHARGITGLVLLTQTADAFFARLGYAVVERDAVPDAVRDSAEFRSLCPASAICMLKPL
jgi:amino-acid N-acetyltransferase